MKKLLEGCIFFIIASGLLLSFAYSVQNVYGHGISSGPVGRPARIDNEQFSDNQASTVGGFITIRGTLVSNIMREVEMSPYIVVTPSEAIDAQGVRHGVPPYHNLLNFIYPPYRDQSSWYFRMEHSMPSSFVLGPGEGMDYEIRVYPLKAGSYHVHSYFVAKDFAAIGRGQTIIVSGSSAPTAGEFMQLYLPFAIGVASLALLVLGIMRARARSAREKAARIYFAAKSSFETVWLAGILSWAAASPYMYSIDTRFAFAAATAVALALVAAGGYSFAVARARQPMLAMATSIATAAFYSFLLFGEPFGVLQNRWPVFYVDGPASFVIIVANSLIAIYFAIVVRRERNRAQMASLPP